MYPFPLNHHINYKVKASKTRRSMAKGLIFFNNHGVQNKRLRAKERVENYVRRFAPKKCVWISSDPLA